jgi:hypothetical protein
MFTSAVGFGEHHFLERNKFKLRDMKYLPTMTFENKAIHDNIITTHLQDRDNRTRVISLSDTCQDLFLTERVI